MKLSPKIDICSIRKLTEDTVTNVSNYRSHVA